jgi:hypothetical protein
MNEYFEPIIFNTASENYVAILKNAKIAFTEFFQLETCWISEREFILGVGVCLFVVSECGCR